MEFLLGFIGFVSSWALIIGLFSPRKVLRWGREEKKTRGRVLLVYGAVFLLSVGTLGAIQDHPPVIRQRASEPAKPAPVAKEQPPKPEKIEPKPKEQPVKPIPQPVVKWNVEELDVVENGNIERAIKLLQSSGNAAAPVITPEPFRVAKTPWNYYGKMCRFVGEVKALQDYPPGGETAEMFGGAAAGIVLFADDDTIIAFFLAGSTGNLKKGDRVAVFGYPVGLVEVENQLGGKTTQLVIVGNTFNR